MPQSPPPILIVEDSPEDFEATSRAFARAGVGSPILQCLDGDQLMTYLRRTKRAGREPDGAQRPAPRPGLILLDLNLPGTDGRDALAMVKRDPDLRDIPVVVLTTSSDDRDIEWCYRLGANSYIQKPVDLEQHMRLVGLIAEYWLRTVMLPKGGPVPGELR